MSRRLITVLVACGTESFHSVGIRWGNRIFSGLGGLEGCVMRSSFFRKTPYRSPRYSRFRRARDLLKNVHANRCRQGLSYVLSGLMVWI